MAEPLGDLTRTHTCGALRPVDVGTDVTLLGWVHRIRDLGGVTFVDIRDRAGLSQIVVRDDEALMAVAKRLRPEYVIGVTGPVQRRSEDTVNPRIATGEVEVLGRAIRVLSEAKTPPFQIADDSPVSEDVRLRYRYLDLRRARLQQNIGLRHRISMATRQYLDRNGFWEIETPILAKSTPEGARDFLVPSRLHPGEFYALPQSPQIFKQILMIAGTDRYFQIVRCFRDEDQRADRQLEFTQIDIEMSFARPESIYALMEPLLQQILKEAGREVSVPFRRMPYAEAIAKYGSDKPDLRCGLEIHDLSDTFRECEFRVFQKIVAGAGRCAGSRCREETRIRGATWTAWWIRPSRWDSRASSGSAPVRPLRARSRRWARHRSPRRWNGRTREPTACCSWPPASRTRPRSCWASCGSRLRGRKTG